MLLCVLIFAISYIQSFFPPERSKQILGRFKGIWANLAAALLGTVTPFCSCSSIPLFIGFTSAGLPLGVTFSFLISSPMVDLGSLVLLMSIFGAKVAVVYVVVGLAIAVVGGTIIEKLRMERYVEDFIFTTGSIDLESPDLTIRDRLIYAREQVAETFRKVFPYILVGVAVGAVIHNWIPETWIQNVLGSGNPFGVVLAVLVGVPMYADIFGTIPVAEALLAISIIRPTGRKNKRKNAPREFPSGRWCSMDDQASLAFASSVRAVKAALSLTAISASILRLISMPASFRPCMKLE